VPAVLAGARFTVAGDALVADADHAS
jgi:hypothetical protein